MLSFYNRHLNTRNFIETDWEFYIENGISKCLTLLSDIITNTETLLYFINTCRYKGSKKDAEENELFRILVALNQILITEIKSLGLRRARYNALISKVYKYFNDYSLPLNLTRRFSLRNFVCSSASIQRLLPFYGYWRPYTAPIEK
jgi:hypothetical protein